MSVPAASVRFWRTLTWLAAAFTMLTGVLLLSSALQTRNDDPLRSSALKDNKRLLRNDPENQTLKAHIRELDLRLRERYFTHIARRSSGVYLILTGVALFVFAAARVRSVRVRSVRVAFLSNPAEPQNVNNTAKWARCSVGLVGGFALLALLFLGFAFAPAPLSESAKTAIESPSELPVAEAELLNNWHEFRGPTGSGVVVSSNVPSRWDTTNSNDLRWKVPNPGLGYSSPIVWESRVYLTGATETELVVFCVDLQTGEVVWRASQNFANPNKKDDAITLANIAAPTPVTDGRRLYSFFGTGDLLAFTLDGQLAWKRSFGPLKNQYGQASSPRLCGDKLILQIDQGEAEQSLSRLYGLDLRTGLTKWQTSRKVGSSWATPLVIKRSGKTQVITAAVPYVISYDAQNGSELWKTDGLNGEVTPSPVQAGELALLVSPSEKLMAIRPDGSGDVTKTKVVWSSDENVPDITSPVSGGGLVFTLTTSGTLTCFDSSDGRKQWEHEFETEFHASPAIAGGRIYLFSRKGGAAVVDVGRTFTEAFRTQMEDVFDASPAFVEGRIILRGETSLWCLGSEKLQASNSNPQGSFKVQTSSELAQAEQLAPTHVGGYGGGQR